MRTTFLIIITIMLLFGGLMQGQQLQTIKLLKPSLENDKPFMQAIQERHSSREFVDKPLSLQDLSNVVWCADGINRPDGHRTAPSAMNSQDIDVYVILKDGIYLYKPSDNELAPLAAGDYRADAGVQGYVATAPLNLIYVSDLNKMKYGEDRQAKLLTAALDAGHCSENVYLYCAAAGLSVVVRASIDKEKLAKDLKLDPNQEIMIGQTVGYPKTE